jgi:3-hydroxybutyryl-CoA dehydrogenase
MAIKKVFVVGAGLMGGGITQVTATAGYEVIMRDIAQEPLDKSMKEIERSLGKFVSKEKITEDQAKKALANIKTTTEMADAAEADLVVEAVFEKIELKQDVFKQLDEICKPDCILATNTSAISITSIASVTKRPEKVVGTHFFSPVPMMRLCELIRGLQTSDETLDAALEYAHSIGKETVVVQKDVAGFIANRVGLAMSAVAISLVERGVATPEDIDKAMKLGFAHRMGPLETSDLTGIDVLMNAMKAIYNETQDERYSPPELMQRMVAAGLLGRKTGKGWYDYSTGEQVSYWKL